MPSESRVAQLAIEHPGDDLHVTVRMHAEPVAGLDGVVVVHDEQPVVHHVRRVVVVTEMERVPGVEPVERRMEALTRLAHLDGRAHDQLPTGTSG